MAFEPRDGYIFHGGCCDCENEDLSVCAGCCYMEPDWDLPDKNKVALRRERERGIMKHRAYSAAKRK